MRPTTELKKVESMSSTTNSFRKFNGLTQLFILPYVFIENRVENVSMLIIASIPSE